MSKEQLEPEISDSKSPVDCESHLKHRDNVVLIPQPSDDPKDPLVSPCIHVENTLHSFPRLTCFTFKNWPQSKKYTILAILSLTAFSGLASSLANQLGLEAQAELYGKTLTELSYTVGLAHSRAMFLIHVACSLTRL